MSEEQHDGLNKDQGLNEELARRMYAAYCKGQEDRITTGPLVAQVRDSHRNATAPGTS